MITLEFAIRKMTSLAAQRVGIADRGLLKAGMFADITVFDPATIIDNSTYENPQQVATGVSYVIVNGVPVDQTFPRGSIRTVCFDPPSPSPSFPGM